MGEGRQVEIEQFHHKTPEKHWGNDELELRLS
jgi:hypothetical protein